MTEPNKYRIKTLEDILQVPTESLDNLFIDLKFWHKTMLELQKIKTPEGITMIANGITFIDDGEHEGHLKFQTKIVDK